MRFRSRHQVDKPNVIVTQSNRKNEDRLGEDASLKAAQAMFKKHTVSQGFAVSDAPGTKLSLPNSGHGTPAHNVQAMARSSSSSSATSTPINIIRRSPRSSLKGKPMGGLSVSPRTVEGNAALSQQAAAVALENEISGDESIVLVPAGNSNGSMTRSNSSINAIRIVPGGGLSSSRSSSKVSIVKNSPTHSLALADKLNSITLESVYGKPSTATGTATRTLAGRKAPPAAFIDQDSVLSNDKHSENEDTPIKGTISYDTTARMNVPVTYEGTLPDLIPGHQRHKKKKWRNIFGSSATHGSSAGGAIGINGTSASGNDQYENPSGTVSELQLNRAEDNLIVKSVNPTQKTRLQTTLRSNDYDRNSELAAVAGGYSSDESAFSSDSDRELHYATDNHHNNSINNHSSGVYYGNVGGNGVYNGGTAGVGRTKHRAMVRSHKRKSFNEDKPWKSHVDIGYISERERKRYEGIWVTNRNSYLELLPWWNQPLQDEEQEQEQEREMDHESQHGLEEELEEEREQESGQGQEQDADIPEDGLMLNLIVMEIWSRSNLSNQLLGQIYDKVDTRHDGTLNRQSFLTGMWLVDQCLYGRKLPKQIDQRVWDSVDKFVISIPNNNPHHRHRRRKKMLRKELKTIKKDLKT